MWVKVPRQRPHRSVELKPIVTKRGRRFRGVICTLCDTPYYYYYYYRHEGTFLSSHTTGANIFKLHCKHGTNSYGLHRHNVHTFRKCSTTWPSWLSQSKSLTHEVVTHQPWIRRRSGKVRQLPTDVLTTEPHRRL